MQRWTGVSDVDETSEGTEGAASHQRDEQECEGCSFSMSAYIVPFKVSRPRLWRRHTEYKLFISGEPVQLSIQNKRP